MTPHEQLIQAKAKDLTPEQAKRHLARIDNPIYKTTNNLYFGLMERDFGNDEDGDIDFIKGILTAFAAQIEADTREEDAKRFEWLEQMMRPDSDYCEVYFAGLRNWTGEATAFQIESSPEKFPVMNAKTLREAIDKAMQFVSEKSK